MTAQSIPSLEEFLAAPVEEIAKVAPTTMVYAPGGTRRQAVFQGIEPWSDDYVAWARRRTLEQVELIFQHGVTNLIVIAFTPGNLKEVDRYRAQLFERAKWVIAGPESLAQYTEARWRVRFLGTDSVPELRETANKLKRETLTASKHTLYWHGAPDSESPWQELLAALCQKQVKTRSEAVQLLYEEEIPPATLYLAFGKPMVSLELIPPLLVGQLQCYWYQQPGYTLTTELLRKVLYDYGYLRQTWQEEKLERAKQALAQRGAWEEAPFLGLGLRLGPFWYPTSIASSAWSQEATD
ncbi:MAG: hypothetical protein U0350_36950 [Caldilineaceae bacterium]